MADNPSSGIGLIGVLIGALIVILVGGGILYATGAMDTKPTLVSAPPATTTPAPAAKADNDGDRRGDRRSDWRDRDRDRDDHDRDRHDRDGRDRDRRP